MKFNTLYIDCPWNYRQSKVRGAARKHYSTLSNEDIYNLDIPGIAAKDCILLLWVTFPCLEEGLEAIRRWGFIYKSIGFCWVKKCKKQTDKWFWGCGNWTRSNPEICLLAIQGRPTRLSRSVHSVIDTPIEHHSKKPDIVREKIVELAGDVPRAELFARQKYDGWMCLGNEIDGLDIREAIKLVKEDKYNAV